MQTDAPTPPQPVPAARPALPPEALRRRCVPEELPFETTDELEPLEGFVGQEDAIEALRYGLETFAPGQNVYVRGLTGTGRLSLVRRLLEEIQPACPLASDYLYATNFDDVQEPKLLTLPRGRGRAFREAMDQLIGFLTRELAESLESDAMHSRKAFLDERFQAEAKEISQPFEDELSRNQLVMVTATVGGVVRPVLLPLIDGEPAPAERLQRLRAQGALSDEDVEAWEKRVSEHADRFAKVARDMQKVQTRHVQAVRDLFAEEVRSLVGARAGVVREAFSTPDVDTFLDALIEDVVEIGPRRLQEEKGMARRYQVNLILGHGVDEGCPVIVENTPTLANLLGGIDRRVLPEGVVVSDHLMITAGSLLRADGGYLVLEAREVLSEPGAWRVLVRTLRTGCLEIVPSEMGGPWSIRTLKPAPIPIQVKVVLIGDAGLYGLLDAGDADFPHLFKVLADFERSIPRESVSELSYARVLARLVRDEKLTPFDRGAVAMLIEHAARIAGRNDRLTSRFGRLADVAREASFVATKAGERHVTADSVREAVRRSRHRGDLPARRYRDLIADGTIRIHTKGELVGQVNGLAVMSAGPLTYGFPSRITATIGAGAAGVINIERESQLSGAIHTKGFYILGGLLRHLLQTPHPLAFSASIAFEQSYGGIDGDSASGAEMCCLLSALTGVPLRQELAMTGAIDQHGNLQPIGAATEKIEGFFDVCKESGLTGTQGVLIPKANVDDLMLSEEVVAACARGEFHVYGLDTIQEALEVFTGRAAGELDDEGEYPEGTLLHLAVERAFEFWSLASARPVFESEPEEADATPAEPPGSTGPTGPTGPTETDAPA